MHSKGKRKTRPSKRGGGGVVKARIGTATAKKAGPVKAAHATARAGKVCAVRASAKRAPARGKKVAQKRRKLAQ